MLDFTVYFAHGRDSGPVCSHDDSDTRDPDLRVARLVEAAQTNDGPVVLVGSSMGGYVVTAASGIIRPAGLFLMAPAFGMPGYAEPMPAR